MDRQALSAAPERTLSPLRGLVVLDEVQTMPQLLPVLRVLADRRGTPARFLLLGSASPDLVQGASESLAGRVAFVYLSGFDVTEVGPDAAAALWERGGFPRSFLRRRRRGQLRVAAGLHRDVSEPRRRAVRHQPAAGGPAAVLDDAGALARRHARTRRNWAAPSRSTRRPPAATWTSWPARSWCGGCRRGSRTRASAW